MLSSKVKAYFAIVFSYIIIGLNPLMLKITVGSVTALEILAYRLTLAFVCALIPVLLRKVKLNINFRDVLVLLPVMIIYAICFFTLQTLSLQRLPSTEAGIIFALSPIVTAVLAAAFLKEKTNGMQIVFITMSIAGVIFIMLMKGASAESFNIIGVAFMALTTITYATQTIMLRRVTGRYPSYTITFMVAGLGFIVYNITLIVSKLIDGTITRYFSPLADWRILLAAIFLGCGGMFATSFFQSYALKYIESTKTVVFMSLGTVITIFAGVVFLSEPLHWYHILGAAAIVAGVIGTNWFGSEVRARRRADKSSNQP